MLCQWGRPCRCRRRCPRCQAGSRGRGCQMWHPTLHCPEGHRSLPGSPGTWLSPRYWQTGRWGRTTGHRRAGRQGGFVSNRGTISSSHRHSPAERGQHGCKAPAAASREGNRHRQGSRELRLPRKTRRPPCLRSAPLGTACRRSPQPPPRCAGPAGTACRRKKRWHPAGWMRCPRGKAAGSKQREGGREGKASDGGQRLGRTCQVPGPAAPPASCMLMAGSPSRLAKGGPLLRESPRGACLAGGAPPCAPCGGRGAGGADLAGAQPRYLCQRAWRARITHSRARAAGKRAVGAGWAGCRELAAAIPSGAWRACRAAGCAVLPRERSRRARLQIGARGV